MMYKILTDKSNFLDNVLVILVDLALEHGKSLISRKNMLLHVGKTGS